MNIFLPHPESFRVQDESNILFIAGPVRNGGAWQESVMSMLRGMDDAGGICLASPTRFVSDKVQHLIAPNTGVEVSRQREWERHYISRAQRGGCLMFWLAKQAGHEHLEKVYAHITMMELGSAIKAKALDPSIRLVIGADPEFPELSTILYEIEQEIPGFVVESNLYDTVKKSVHVLKHGV